MKMIQWSIVLLYALVSWCSFAPCWCRDVLFSFHEVLVGAVVVKVVGVIPADTRVPAWKRYSSALSVRNAAHVRNSIHSIFPANPGQSHNHTHNHRITQARNKYTAVQTTGVGNAPSDLVVGLV